MLAVPQSTAMLLGTTLRGSVPRVPPMARSQRLTLMSDTQQSDGGWTGQVDSIFDAIDANGDGAITVVDLGAHLGQVGYTDDTITKLFTALDTNADGAVSRAEMRESFRDYDISALRKAFGVPLGYGVPLRPASRGARQIKEPRSVDWSSVEGATGRTSEERAAMADAVFDTIDANGDGALTLLELREHLRAKGYSEASCDGVFGALDLDGDGAVSREELRVSFEKYDFTALSLALGLDGMPRAFFP